MSNSRYSFTALDTFINCPLSFYFKYILRQREDETTLAIELGNICHKIKELCSKELMAGNKPDYEKLTNILYQGWSGEDKTGSGKEDVLAGVSEISDKYFADWLGVEEGIPSYPERVDQFIGHLTDEENDTEWKTIGAELPFELEFHGVTLFGIIDRVATDGHGNYMVMDYKTSKKPYPEQKLKTPLQLAIYCMAVENMFDDVQSVICKYNFVMLGQEIEAGSRGWRARAEKKLAKVIDDIVQAKETGVWVPNASPLCHWCSYCKTSTSAGKYCNNCPYYSLWTPTNKTFEVAEEYVEGTKATEIDTAQKENEFWW